MSEVSITIIDHTGGGDPTPGSLAPSGLTPGLQPSLLSNQAYGNQVVSTDLAGKNQLSNQDALNKLHVSILAKAVNQVQNLQPAQARAVVDVFSNNELAQDIADLKAAVQAFAVP